MGRVLGAVVVVVGSWVFLSVGTPARASHPCPMGPVSSSGLGAAEQELLGHLNRERTARGMRPIEVDGRIAQEARQHAAQMTVQGRVHHNLNYRDADRYDALAINEVVTNDCSPHAAHENFMGSPAHRSTLLTPDWTHGGIGVGSDEAGMLYVVEAFARRGTPPVPPVPPAPSAEVPRAAPAATVVEPPRPTSRPVTTAAPRATPVPATPVPEVPVGIEPMAFERVEVGAAPHARPAAAASDAVGVETAGWSVALVLQWGLLWAVFGGPRRRSASGRRPAGAGGRQRRTHRPEPVGS